MPDPFDLRFLQPFTAGTLLRVGRDEDGGYVVPAAAVEKTRLLLGIGINDDWSFEEDFAARNPAVRIVGVDGTAGLRLLYRKAASRALHGLGSLLTLQFAKAGRKFRYGSKIPRFLEFFRRHTFLRLMLRKDPGAGSITPGQLLEKYHDSGKTPDVFFKMDIEGGEYEILSAPGGFLDAVLCMTVEFHDLGKRWTDLQNIAAMLDPDFLVAHVHGNNYAPLIPGTAVPSALEITWLRRSFAPDHPLPCPGPWPLPDLDRPCKPGAPDYPLAFGDGRSGIAPVPGQVEGGA
ncbi:MAG TPA: hypothetical protein VHM91_13645 [Verrucomicrobiales bacterium]|nr:hypothetical protein [Verrucomicrobiales bacterium]